MSTPSNVVRTAEAMSGSLDTAIGSAQEELKRSIRRLEQRIMADFKKLQTGPDGRLVGPKVNLKQAQAVHKDLIKRFEESYDTGVRRAVKGFNEVAQAIQESWPDLESSMQYTGADRTMMDTLANQAVVEFEQYGAQAQERIARAMYDQVVAGGQFSELVAEMAAILGTGVDKRGNSMARYAELWANDGIMNFHQAVTLNKAKEAGLTMFLYYGNIIKTSRPFCIDRAGKIFTLKEIESWNELSWQGKSGPPLTYRGGWNCRHHWHPIKKEWIPDGSIQVGDYFEEAGITIARGNTVPPWPGVKRAAKPKPVGERPVSKAAPYTDPHQRWVPFEDPYSSEADRWAKQVYKNGEEFAEWAGLGPCAPVADNIVEVLQAQGRNARVMCTTYLPKNAKTARDAYTHYVAVELDDFGRVIRIYDPTNPHVTRAINDLVPGKLPPEYFPKGSWTRWGPRDARNALSGTVEEMGAGTFRGDHDAAQAFIDMAFQSEAQHTLYYGTADNLVGGIAYDVVDEQVVVKAMGKLGEGGRSKALHDLVAQASDDNMAVYIRAGQPGGYGAGYLEELGFVKDVRKGQGWYVASNDNRQLRNIQYKLDKRFSKVATNYTGMDEWRDETVVFRANQWARDDGMIYSRSEHEWWYGKLNQPGSAAAEARQAIYSWEYESTKTGGRRQLEKLAMAADDEDLYTRVSSGEYAWRFRHSSDTPAKRWASGEALTKTLHGKAIVSDAATPEAINMVGRKFAELQNRSRALGVPRLRTMNLSGWVRGNTLGSMGDGVLSLKASSFNRFAKDAVFDLGKYEDELRVFIKDAKGALEAAAKVEGKRSANYLALKEMIEQREAEIRLIKQGTWQAPAFGGHRTTATSFKPLPGKRMDDIVNGTRASSNMPYTTEAYFENGVEKAISTMEHEYAHHIHQQLFVRGDIGRLNDPPLERWLKHHYNKLDITNRANNVSTYSIKNHKEWFAENYAMWRAGKKNYVREELRGLMAALDDLEAGKISEDTLYRKLFSGGYPPTGYNAV